MKRLAYSPKLTRRMRLGLDRLNQIPCTSASRSNPRSRTTASESANSTVGSLHFTQAIEKLSTRRWRLMESRHRHNAELSRSASRDAVFDLVTTQLVDHSPPPDRKSTRLNSSH